MQIDFKCQQNKKASGSIRVNRDSDSNVNDERDRQSEKHFFPIISTVAGIRTDRSATHSEKAQHPIRVSFEPDSNDNDESDLQCEKQPL
jgi:hypothetical protein